MKLICPVEGDPGMFLWWCPGCKETHGVWTEAPNSMTGAKWSFNGNHEKPTFEPSILTRGTKFTAKGEEQYEAYRRGEFKLKEGESFDSRETRCHVFIRDGMIQYCADCSHEFAGRTVPMEPLPEWR